ncbi:MAG: C10 family peptidase [Bacteroidales bacterium]|nr:C10 family peptidase [Bacteroidales bacterium]
MKKHQSILIRVLPLLMVLLTATVLQAAPVSRTTARQAAYSFLQGKGVNLAGPNALTDVSARTNLSNIYIFDCAGVGGYAVVAADNRVKPILSYSQQDNFPQTVPADLQNRLARYDHIVADAVRDNVTPSPEVTNQWQELLGNDNDGSKDEDNNIDLQTSLWGDCAPFNTRCPFDLDGEQYHCKVGSLAVAVGELIYYWYSYIDQGRPYEYPFFHGSTSYNDDTYGTLTADFSGPAIRRQDVIRTRTGSSNQNPSFDSIATFLAKLAIGMHTKFGPYESKATLESALACLAYHFGYDTSTRTSPEGTTYSDPMHIYATGNWSSINVDSILTSELYNERPVLCAAYNRNNTRDTHYFLIDGYFYRSTDNMTFFHLNWGDQNDTLDTRRVGSVNTVFSSMGDFYYPTINDQYRLCRMVTGLKPKANWMHTDKDLIELPWTGTNFQAERDYAHSIHLYYSSWDDWINNQNSFAAAGLYRRPPSSTGISQVPFIPEDSSSNYGQNVREVFMNIDADSMSSTTTTLQCFFQSDYASDTAWFTIRQQPRYPSDTIIHDNGEFDHAVNNQSSVAQKWGIRIPRSEFEGLGSLTQVMLFTPSVGNYSIYWDTVASDTDRPQVNTNRMAQIRVMQTDTVNIWRTASFTSPINISSSTNYLWIFIDAYDWGNIYIGSWAAVSSRPGTGEYWYRNENGTWQQMSSDYSWMIRPIFLNSSCERPSDLSVDAGDRIANISWRGPEGASFEIEMGPHGFTHGDTTSTIFRYPDNGEPIQSEDGGYGCTLIDSNGDAIQLPNSSSFDFYIRSVCISDNSITYSPWVGLDEPIETECDAFPIPFYEDFTNGFPQCWEEISMSGILEWLMNSGYWTSNMRLPSGLFPINPQPQPSDGNILPTAGAPADSAMLITPPIDISTAVSPRLTFCQRQTSYVSTDTNVINIYYRTAEDAAWVLLYRDSIYSYDIDTVILNLPRPNPSVCTQYQLGFEIMTDGVLGAVFGAVSVQDSFPRRIVTSAYPTDAGTTSGDGEYTLADQATVSATANMGYHFDHWEIHSIYGTVTSYQNPLRISVFADYTCVAIFEHGNDIECPDTRSIAVYPNPTTGRLTLDADDVRSVEVIDMMGRIVYTARETNQLDLGPLPRGAYLLRITLPNDVCVTKINKQ